MAEKKKINVLEFISNLREGGAESLVRDYALLLDVTRFNVITLIMGPVPEDSPYVKALREKKRIIVSVFPEEKKIAGICDRIWHRLIFRHSISTRMLEIIHQYDIDVIHCHLEVLSYIRYISKRIKNIPIYFTCHNEVSIIFKKVERWKDEDAAARYLFKHNIFRIIALHENMRKEINERFGVTNTVVVHNGIDFNRFKNVPQTKEQLRSDLGIPKDAFVVGHIGRFGAAKNHLFIADVFYNLKKQKNNAFLLLVGTGSLRKDFDDKINLLGVTDYVVYENRRDIPQLLKTMDVFILPSKWEGLPVVLVEAQVVGLRCLISDKVTEECFFSEKAIPLPIDQSVTLWVNTILDETINGHYNYNISSFDMKEVINVIENLYSAI